MDALVPIGILLFLFFILWGFLYFLFVGVLQSLRRGFKHFSEKILSSRVKHWAVAKYPKLSSLRQYVPLFVIIIIGMAGALIAGDLFLDLAEDFRKTDSSIYQADHAVNLWFEGERHFGLTKFFSMLTQAAGPIGMGLIIAVTAGYFFLKKKIASGIFMIVTGTGGFLLNAGLKMIYMRVRPDAATAIAIASWYSFPSGHAMASFIVLGALSYLILRLVLDWMIKSAILAFIVLLIILVGMSRLYLGVHWISDIIAGWSAGTVWLTSATVGYETLMRIRQLRHQRKKAA